MAIIAARVEAGNWNTEGGCTLIIDGQISETQAGTMKVTLPTAELVEQLKKALERSKGGGYVVMRRRRR